MPSAITSRHGQPRNPVTAAAAPAQPAQRYPTITVTLRTLGPGRSWPSAKRSTNSCSVSQHWRSTSTRRAQNTMPPKPDRVILEKVRNRAHAVTWGRCAAGRASESGGVDMLFPSLRGIKVHKQHLDSLRRKDALRGAETTETSVRLENYFASHFEGSAHTCGGAAHSPVSSYSA